MGCQYPKEQKNKKIPFLSIKRKMQRKEKGKIKKANKYCFAKKREKTEKMKK